MSLPPLFSLSNELILEIISHLPPKDICTIRLACFKLNSLIVKSQLIQYIIRTAQSGVFDTLEPGLSLPERQDALQQWESSWAEMDLRKPGVRIYAPVTCRNGQPVEFSFGRYFVVIREGYGRPAGYSFMDMSAKFSPQDDGAAVWTKIEVETPNVLVLAFASELDLSVAISAPSTVHRHQTILKIYPMDFATGKPHPLASQPVLEVAVPGASAYNLSDTEVIGDYILYWVGSSVYSHANEVTLSNIYLIAWKEGWVSELRQSETGVYGSVLSVLSKEIILLVRLRDPALELCRLTNIGGPNQSLETVCILSLPGLLPGACLRWATCFGEHPGHALFTKNSKKCDSSDGGNLSSLLSQRRPRYQSKRHLRSIPSDGIVSVVMHIHSKSGDYHTVDLSVRCRTLLAFAAGNVPEVVEGRPRVVPWEEWGPEGTRILEHDSHTWGSLVGERRATVGQKRLVARITMRDYNPFRLTLALERLGEPNLETEFPSGCKMKVVTAPSSYDAGDLFSHRVETRLPFVETVTPYPGCEGIFMDEDHLLVEVRTEERERNFFLHCL